MWLSYQAQKPSIKPKSKMDFILVKKGPDSKDHKTGQLWYSLFKSSAGIVCF